MQVGTTVPQFRDDADAALEAATRAEALGLDGVFVFDHLWPIGRPESPALHSLTLLGALAAETSSVVLGPMVARVSLLPESVLVDALETLRRVAGPRVVAGLGTGDRSNREENAAYGLPALDKAARLARLVACCRGLRAKGVPTWVGGLSPEVRRVAAEEADGWNAWGVALPAFSRWAGDFPTASTLSWGGQVLLGGDSAQAQDKLRRHGARPGLVHGTVPDARRHLQALADAGASWAICAPLDVMADRDSLPRLAEAASGVQ